MALSMMVKHRQLLLRTLKSELRRRYAGSIIGSAWFVLGPALLVSFYSLVYLLVFRVKPEGLEPMQYVMLIVAGLSCFLGFSEALQVGTTSLSANREVLLNTLFPAELVSVRAVLSSIVPCVVSTCLVVAFDVATGGASWTLILVPFVLVLQIMFCIGVTWASSLLNLVIRDIQQIISYLMMMLMVASPIAYTPAMMPSAIKALIYLNPLSYYVLCLQDLVVFNRLPPWEIGAVTIVMSLASFRLGSWVFSRAKGALFDFA